MTILSRATACTCAILAILACPAAEPALVTGKVESVILYRGEALVTRAIPIAGKGPCELLVGPLPEQINGASLFAEGGAGIDVRAVRFRTRAVGVAPREPVQQLDEAIATVQEGISRNQAYLGLMNQKVQILDAVRDFGTATAKTDLAKGVLDANALARITEEQFERRTTLLEERLKLEKERRGLDKQLQLLQAQRQAIAASSSTVVREAVIFCDKAADDAGTIRLSYLVSGATWSPSYNLRATDNTTVRVEYNAMIQQLSGEDWSAVRLTLSTASPVLSAQGANLAPHRIALMGKDVQNKSSGQSFLPNQQVQEQITSLSGQRYQGNYYRNRSYNFDDNVANDMRLNSTANAWVQLELQADRDSLVLLRASSTDTQAPSIDYDLARPIDLASRDDQQMVRIANLDLTGDFYHVATPLLTDSVFREAAIDNASEQTLLGGPVAVYLDGRFVGRGELPTVAAGQTFIMGFGSDPQLRARRELVDRQERVQGGNRIIEMSYRLTLESYKEAATVVRLMERMPLPSNGADVRITLEEGADKLSQNALYLRELRPKNILRWEIEVAAKASGEQARQIDYKFRMEFDRNQIITEPQVDQSQALDEYRQMQMRQQKQ